MSLGQRICQYRTKQGMSQLELAEQLDVSRQSISKWETDASIPELEKLVKMCELFDVTLDELVRGERLEKPGPEGEETQNQMIVIQQTPARLVVGGILLLCGIALFMVLCFAESADFGASLFVGSAVAIPGIICLKAKENIGLWCFFVELAIWAFLYPSLAAVLG